ncbi:MAG: glutamate--tRNA ligase [Anaerolineae bacterium]|nr:glutamate--tRNA ligase [Anaerolineae bacterium]
MTVRVRFAPSPTGHPHIGNIRTVVFNWLFARQNNGKFILRIEDTDRTRYVEDAVKVITDSLTWLGLDWDEGPDKGGPYGPYTQSKRLDIYREKAEELVAKGLAYRCNCKPERLEKIREENLAKGLNPMYDRHCRDLPPDAVAPNEPHVIRLKVPLEGTTTVHDELKGDVTFDNTQINDQILLKTDGFPTYHLAVVVDDHMMDITHIIRADEWLPSTPKHVMLYEAFGWEPPIFIHVPLVLGQDGKKLSKRHGAVSIADFHRQGYLPEAVFNFLSLLGWSPGEGDEQEIFTREELIERFDIERVNLAPAVFAYDKLDWMNGVHIRNMSEEDLLHKLIPVWQEVGFISTPVQAEMLRKLEKLVPLVQERLKTVRDVIPLTDFVFTDIEMLPAEELIGKKMTVEQSIEALQKTQALLATLVNFDDKEMEQPMRDLATELGLKAGQLFTIVRNAVTAKTVTPPLFGLLEVIGRETTLRRLEQAEETLKSLLDSQAEVTD